MDANLTDSDFSRKQQQNSAVAFRTAIHRSIKERSTFLGLTLFAGSSLLYTVMFLELILSRDWWLKSGISLVLASVIAALFAIGHDACHGSLTAVPWLNRFLGRLAFLPTFHPYAAWELTHNGKHHGFTNVRGEDIVYVPYSQAEFARLPSWRCLAERIFRSPCGLGPLYFLTIYMPHEMFPSFERRPPGRQALQYQFDRAVTVSFFCGQCFLLLRFGNNSLVLSASNILFGLLVPQVIFHSLMGFVTFLHHTHPKVPWYADRTEYSYHRSQICSTVHIEFPWIIDLILHRILNHTAHHVDPHIPLYHLADAQTSLERRFDEIIHEPFTFSGFLNTLRTCRLYDYEKHAWLDFNGVPTTDSLFRSNDCV